MLGNLLAANLEKIVEGILEFGQSETHISGTDSALALASLLSQSESPHLWAQPLLILLPTKKDVESLEAHLDFFESDIQFSSIDSFDVSPFSGLYPNHKGIAKRIRWLATINENPYRHIFIATPSALMQKCIPRSVLSAHTLKIHPGDIIPEKFVQTLANWGYQSVPLVEDVGTFAVRGGIIDIFSPAHDHPIRIDLFGDNVESLRLFDQNTQRSIEQVATLTVLPSREIIYSDDSKFQAIESFKKSTSGRPVDSGERDSIVQSMIHGQYFPGVDFLLNNFYPTPEQPLQHFGVPFRMLVVNPIEVAKEAELFLEEQKRQFGEANAHSICPNPSDLYVSFEELNLNLLEKRLSFSNLEIIDFASVQSGSGPEESDKRNEYSTVSVFLPTKSDQSDLSYKEAFKKLITWKNAHHQIFVACGTQTQAQRLQVLFEKEGLSTKVVSESEFSWLEWLEEQKTSKIFAHLIPRTIGESVRLSADSIIFLRDEDFFGSKKRRREVSNKGTLLDRVETVTFGDINPGDLVVHTQHGVATYEGLKVMDIQGVKSEFLQLTFRDSDRLYLPIYRIAQIQKFSGPNSSRVLDKLGTNQFQKTKAKVKNQLRDVASELLSLYAKRKETHREPIRDDDEDFHKFELSFPYDETADQLRAIAEIEKDFVKEQPMDRLVCGDVGFGKTEVAMRAAFKAAHAGRQVAVLAPTTVLSFQHLETFQMRFRNWPFVIKALNRFVSPADAKKTIQELKEGKIDIIIGTHRLLSKDILFKNLGLVIVDEEQKFGVLHKEKVKKMRTSIDSLTLSATPIPRTLNMSLLGIRDLSIINTPPVDRLPTRTFVCKFDQETIRKGIQSEISRGGQVFFLHNRVQSIHALADELRQIVPEARLRIGHGQMEEHELEEVMVAFFKHEIDILVCTTIIEAGIDNPRANTMFIDNAHTFGLSQLYQLRGRVGRSKERAYCYLLIPPNKRLESDAQERLKVIQENTALGSGIRIAHHDLELRGAGSILGEDQSGQIDAVGYEMYLELLDETLREAKGEPVKNEIEPEINVRIPALIPDDYIPDVKMRLGYYRVMSTITSPDDMDKIEDELQDQFGKAPEAVVNLMGLMLIRYLCKKLGVRDLSHGPKAISLAFTQETPLPPEKVVSLAQMLNRKFSVTPDNRLLIRMNTISWPNIFDELQHLLRFC